jgi:hypothetical protein
MRARLAAATRALGRRLLPYLAALGCVTVSALALLPQPSGGTPPPTADYVIVLGAAGLRWEDVDQTRTPNLWRLAERGAVGALSVRSARTVTCPEDGWVTLGAGNRARRTAPDQPGCDPLRVPISQPEEPGASVIDQRSVVRDNRALSWEVQPGALAEAVRCTTAIGPGAAIAGARPFGRVDRYLPAVDQGLARQLVACSLSIVDLGTVAGSGAERFAAARAADATLAAVLAARPERALVVVAGLSDTGETGRLHVVIAHGPGYEDGWLSSRSTGRSGYLELVDLAPTVLAALDRPAPAGLFAGAAAQRAADRPEPLAGAVEKLADADRQSTVQRIVADRFFLVLVLGQLALLVALIPVLRRLRRPAGPQPHPPVPRAVVRLFETALAAAALAVPAALVADLVPWWRWRLPGTVFALVTSLVLCGVTVAVSVLTRRYRAVGPIGVVSALAAAAVAIDVLTGARLQLNGVAGYSAATSGRYSGLGTVGLGVLAGGTLLLAAAVAQRVGRGWRPSVVAAIGAVGVVVVGSPYLGADAAGAAALSGGVCLAAAAAAGGWFTLRRLGAAVATAALATVGFALVDLARPVDRRSNVARFLVDLNDGTGGLAGQRLGAHNVVAMATSPFTLLVVGTLVFAALLMMRPWGGLRRLLGLYPSVRAALGGVGVATLMAGLIEGVGLNVLGSAVATVGPLVALGALRVLDHANDRTPCDTGRPMPVAEDKVLA